MSEQKPINWLVVAIVMIVTTGILISTGYYS